MAHDGTAAQAVAHDGTAAARARDGARNTAGKAPAVGEPSGTRLANGERLELTGSGGTPPGGGGTAGTGFRVVPRPGAGPEPYVYTRTDSRLEVQPAGRTGTLPATTVGTGTGGTDSTGGTGTGGPSSTGGTAKPAAPAARPVEFTQPVKLQLTNATHTGFQISVWNRTTWQWFNVRELQSKNYGMAHLPSGDYFTVGALTDGSRPGHLITASFTVQDKALTVPLDARTTREVALTPDDPTAQLESSSVTMRLPGGDTVGHLGAQGGSVKVTPFSLRGASLRVHQALVRKGSSVNNPSPYRYDLFRVFKRTLPASPKVQVRTAELARTTVSARPSGADSTAVITSQRSTDFQGAPLSSRVRLPYRVVEYATPGDFILQTVAHPDGGYLYSPFRIPVVGANPDVTFGAAPFANRACTGSETYVHDGMLHLREHCAFGDASGNQGIDFNAVEDLTYAVDGVTVDEVRNRDTIGVWQHRIGRSGVPHTLTRTIRQQGDPTRLTPVQTHEWSFTPPSAGLSAVPFTEVDLRVDGLDDRNRAGAAPVTVTATASSRTRNLTSAVTGVEFSTDDGGTWTALPLEGSGTTATARLTVPRDARAVSLRATGTSSDGSGLRRTIVRAFHGPERQGDGNPGGIGAIKIGKVVVNGGRVIAPALVHDPATAPYRVTFEVTDREGVESSGVRLRRGSADRPDAVLDTRRPFCVKENLTTNLCTAEFALDARGALGRNALAGEWAVDAWARSRDGAGVTRQSGVGTAQILRQTRVTIAGPPDTVTRGRSFAVTGIAGIADWSTGRWNALPGTPVDLEYRRPNVTAWTRAATVRTGQTGAINSVQKAAFNANWRWLLPRTEGVGAALSPAYYVVVR
ncbi:hypothetical protein [Streptomyces sp. NPDC020965]|uniref:hypothetical protein n=1 Tax=Streptomyces sp. NPDC020965 TaxID=3365105 RepID=UPI003796ED0C